MVSKTTLRIAGTATSTILGPDGLPVSSTTLSFALEVVQTKIVIADPAADEVPELTQLATMPPLFGGNGIVLPTDKQVWHLANLGSQRLLGAEARS